MKEIIVKVGEILSQYEITRKNGKEIDQDGNKLNLNLVYTPSGVPFAGIEKAEVKSEGLDPDLSHLDLLYTNLCTVNCAIGSGTTFHKLQKELKRKAFNSLIKGTFSDLSKPENSLALSMSKSGINYKFCCKGREIQDNNQNVFEILKTSVSYYNIKVSLIPPVIQKNLYSSK